MRSKAYLFAFAVLLQGVSSVAMAQDIRWYNDYKAAREEARRTNKPILLAFRCSP